MKKIAATLALLFVLSVIFPEVRATDPAIDVTPPIISSITYSGTPAIGSTIQYNIVGDDDITGIRTVMIGYAYVADPSRKISVTLQNTSGSQTFSVSHQISPSMTAGQWRADNIQVWDASNLRTYLRATIPPELDMSPLDMSVAGDSSADSEPPMLSSISVKSSSISVPGKVEISAAATDNKSGIKSVSVSYETPTGYALGFSLNYNNATNTYVGTLDLNNAYLNTAKLVFENIILTDQAGNMSVYSYNPSRYTYGFGYSGRISNNLDVTISNAILDSSAPQLVSFDFAKAQIIAPGMLKINLTVNSAYPQGLRGVVSICIVDPVTGIPQLAWGSDLRYISGNQYYCSVPLSENTPSNEYLISRIELTNSSGVKSIYALDASQGSVIERKTANVVNMNRADVATGTTIAGYLDKIRASGQDDVILLDGTHNDTIVKDVFDIIKGTKRTLIFQADGIQWIFSGGDIGNTTKNIKASVTCQQIFAGTMLGGVTLDKPAVKVTFFSNGVLPGRATVRIKGDYAFRSFIGMEDLDVYYLNELNSSLESIAEKISMTSDGFYEFVILHNSSYVIMPRRISTTGTASASDISSASSEEISSDSSSISLSSAISSLTEEKNTGIGLGIWIVISVAILLFAGVGLVLLIPKWRNMARHIAAHIWAALKKTVKR